MCISIIFFLSFQYKVREDGREVRDVPRADAPRVPAAAAAALRAARARRRQEQREILHTYTL